VQLEMRCTVPELALPRRPCRLPRNPAAAFTLLELLAVVGLIGLLAGVAGLSWQGGGPGVARDAAVATLASLIGQARSDAALRGTNAAVFIHVDPGNPARYLRYAVVCEQVGPDWQPLDVGVTLAAGVVVVPNTNPLPESGPGAIKRAGTDWTRPSGGDIRSTALRGPARFAVNATVAELWTRIEFTPHGTTLANGDLIVAPGRLRGPEVPAVVLLANPDDVAGLTLSQYGNVTILRHRRDL